MEVALAAGARVIGINNRDLHTFKLDLTTTSRLTRMVRDAGKLEDHSVQSPSYAASFMPSVLASGAGSSPLRDHSTHRGGEVRPGCSHTSSPASLLVCLSCRYAQDGVSAILVGEALMRAADPGAYIQATCMLSVCYLLQHNVVPPASRW